MTEEFRYKNIDEKRNCLNKILNKMNREVRSRNNFVKFYTVLNSFLI